METLDEPAWWERCSVSKWKWKRFKCDSLPAILTLKFIHLFKLYLWLLITYKVKEIILVWTPPPAPPLVPLTDPGLQPQRAPCPFISPCLCPGPVFNLSIDSSLGFLSKRCSKAFQEPVQAHLPGSFPGPHLSAPASHSTSVTGNVGHSKCRWLFPPPDRELIEREAWYCEEHVFFTLLACSPGSNTY